jgi:hypothetical protein
MRRSRNLRRPRSRAAAYFILAALLLPAARARAGLFAVVREARSGSPSVASYDDAGHYLGMLPYGGEGAAGMDVDDVGSVYIVSNNLGRGSFDRFTPPYRYAPPYTLSSHINTPNHSIPGGVTTDDAGRAYVVGNASTFVQDSRTGLYRYDPATGSVTFIPAAAPATRRAGLVAVSPAGDVFLGRNDDAGALAIERYSGATGAFLGTFINRPADGSGADLEFGPDGNLYLATATGIDRYSAATGAFLGTFVPAGAGGLSGLPDFDFGNDGLLYVNSRGTSSILRFDAATGAFRDVFITPDQYNRAEFIAGLGVIAVAVPEPAACLLFLLPAAVCVRRRGAPSASPTCR